MRPGAFNLPWWCRNITLPSIDYAFGPRLRVRLTLGGFTFPRKPEAFGERDSHPFYRYSFRHDHSHFVQGSLSVPLRSMVRRSPTVALLLPAASVPCLSPVHYRRRTPRPVSYYALFKWWLLLSQHPGCQRSPTSFRTEHG